MTPVPSTRTASPRRRLRRGEGALLRTEVLDAVDRLLLAGADEAEVSVRCIAAEVGVSPPAIYRHFHDKASVLFAVCERHFVALDDAMVTAEAAAADPLDALRARGQAYARFGLSNPQHYRILFMGRPGAAPHDWSAERLAASAAFAHQVDAVQRCIDAGALASDADPRLLAIGLWAAIHGVVSLAISKPDFPWPPLDVLVDHVLDTSGAGLVARAGCADQAVT